MSDKTGNPPGNPPGKPPAPGAGKDAGRLEQDDRGNVTWQWSDDRDLLADDTLGAAERVRALVDPKLDVVDEAPSNSIQSNPKGLKTGYNPYNSGALGKQSWKKKKDLRELSKWIELKKKMANKPEDK
jgi:hypothetical protein